MLTLHIFGLQTVHTEAVTDFLPEREDGLKLNPSFSSTEFLFNKTSEGMTKKMHKSNKYGEVQRSKHLVDEYRLKISNSVTNKLLKDNEKAFK